MVPMRSYPSQDLDAAPPSPLPRSGEVLVASGKSRGQRFRSRIKGALSHTALLRWLRLRNWAKASLKQYGIRDARFTLLKEGRNQRKLIFYVQSPTQGRFILRVYKLSRSSENLIPELLWLQALQRDTSLSVPEPIPTADGSLVGHVSHEWASEPRRCVLLRWLPGRSKVELSLSEASLAGSCVAQLHRYSERQGAPEGLMFPHVWGWDWVFGEAAPLWNKGTSVYSRSEMDVFLAAAERVRQDLQVLGRDRDVFGVIHRDLHLLNFLFDNGKAYPIDFEDCGWGYYLFDLAMPLSTLSSHSAPLGAALLESYQREHPLSEGHWDHLETFMAMRVVQKVNQALGWETPTRRPWGQKFLRSSVKGLKEFVASEGKTRHIDLESAWWRKVFLLLELAPIGWQLFALGCSLGG